MLSKLTSYRSGLQLTSSFSKVLLAKFLGSIPGLWEGKYKNHQAHNLMSDVLHVSTLQGLHQALVFIKNSENHV